MAFVSVRAAEEGSTGTRGVHALRESFQQVLHGVTHIQGYLLELEQSTQDRLRDQERVHEAMMREQERRTEERFKEMEAMIREDRRSAHTSLERVEGATRGTLSAFEDQLRRMEEKVEVLERQYSPSGEEESDRTSRDEERVADLERRMERLEASVERALQSVLPRVDALLAQSEKPPSAVASPQPTTTATYATVAASSHLTSACASGSTLPLNPRSPSTTWTAPPPLTSERRKKLGMELTKAAEQGKEADVHRLLDNGADIDFRFTNGYTPLINAVINARVYVASLLIERGADIHARCDVNRSTALHYASCGDKSGRCTSLLIRVGAVVDSANADGGTPLHVAACPGNVKAAQALLAAGASTTVTDISGKTPFDYAMTGTLRQLLRLE